MIDRLPPDFDIHIRGQLKFDRLIESAAAAAATRIREFDGDDDDNCALFMMRDKIFATVRQRGGKLDFF